MVIEFSQMAFNIIVVGSIIGVGCTLLFLGGVLIKEIKQKQLW